MGTHEITDEATRDRLRLRYCAVGATIGVAVVFGLVMVAATVATPGFGTAFAVGVAFFAALWSGSSFGVIFGNATFEARFGHRTDAEDLAMHEAELHPIADVVSDDRAA